MSRWVAPVIIFLLLLIAPLVPAFPAKPAEPNLPFQVADNHLSYVDRPIKAGLMDGLILRNDGQLDGTNISYYLEGRSMSVTFDEGGFSYLLHPDGVDEGWLVKVGLKDARRVAPVGTERASHSTSFFIGKDPEGWRSNVPSFGGLRFPSVYDGIDLEFKLREGMMKHEFLVSPGADPSKIGYRFEGAMDLQVEESTGDLLIGTPLGTIRDAAPYVFQGEDSARREVDCSYSITNGNEVTYSLNTYDPRLPLVIDPGINMSTFIGGQNWEHHPRGVVDREGNTYVTAISDSMTGYPVTPGAFNYTMYVMHNHVVTKLDETGDHLVYSARIGGAPYSAQEISDIEIDDEGFAYITGQTTNHLFPTTPGAFCATGDNTEDGFVLKLNPKGTELVYSTLLGGSYRDTMSALKVDDNGDVYVVGAPSSGNMPTTSRAFKPATSNNPVRLQIYLAKLSKDGSQLIYGSFGPGSGCHVNDIELDNQGNIIVAGTSEFSIATRPGAFCETYNGKSEAWVFKMNHNLSNLLWSTLIGGSGDDAIHQIELDDDGNIYAAGITDSADFPTHNAYDQSLAGDFDNFVLKLNASGDMLHYSTYLGGTEEEGWIDIDVDGDGILFLSTTTWSNGLHTSRNAYDKTHYNQSDIYIGELNANGTKMWYGSYLGGDSTEEAGSIVIGDGNTTVIGRTRSPDFPTTPGAFDRNHDGYKMYVTRLPTKLLALNQTPPLAPDNLTAVVGIEIVQLKWDPVQGTPELDILEYNVYKGYAIDDVSPIAMLNAGMTTYIDRPHRIGEVHYYTVSATNALGVGARSTMVQVIPAALPSPPFNLTATPSCGTVHITWEPPGKPGGRPILGYSLFRGPLPSSISPLTTLNNVTEYLDEGLEAGQVFYYQVRAFNMFGNGTLSEAVAGRPYRQSDAPLFTSVRSGPSLVTLEWNPPAFDGGTEITDYVLLRGTVEHALERLVTLDASTRSYEDIGLQNGHVYYYAVLAVNIAGEGIMSEIANATPLDAPDAPLDLRIEGVDGTLTVSWQAPTDDGGATIESYNVYRDRTEGFQGWYVLVEGTSFTDTDLLVGETYYYRVTAVNKVGEGPSTGIVSGTPLGLPDPPRSLVVVQAEGEQALGLKWVEPTNTGGADVTVFRVYRGTDEDALENYSEVSSGTLTFVDDGVQLGLEYWYSIASVTIAGEGEMSETVSAIALLPPSVPTSLSVTPGDGQVTIRWEEADEDGGSPIIAYMVYRGISDTDLVDVARVTDILEYVDIGVVNDGTYYYAVAAENAKGEGVWTVVSAAIPTAPATAPGAPRSVRAEVQRSLVNITWLPPSSDGKSPITGYIILRGTSADDLNVIDDVGPEIRSYEDKNLKTGKEYHYSVVASNIIGDSPGTENVVVKIPKKEDGPGFLSGLALIALVTMAMLASPLIRRRELS